MKVTLKRTNDNFRFEGIGKTGAPVIIDNISDEDVDGTSPMELLLMGVGGCSAIDIVSILKKQRQEITDYTIEVEGDRTPVKEAKVFKSMHVRISLQGEIVPEKAKRAAELSFTKYCSVSLTLEPTVEITYDILLNGMKI